MSFKEFLKEAKGKKPSFNTYSTYKPYVKHYSDLPTPNGMSRIDGNRGDGRGGVGTVENPFDPDYKDGASLANVRSDPDMYDYYKREIAKYGGGMHIHPTLRGSVDMFMRTTIAKELGYDWSGVRWALRPPITNWLAGGIPDSYHQTGEAIDLVARYGGRHAIKRLIAALYASGIRGIGLGGDNIHIDSRQTNGKGMIYVYSKYRGPNPVDLIHEMLIDVGEDLPSIRMPKPEDSGLGTSNMSTKTMSGINEWYLRFGDYKSTKGGAPFVASRTKAPDARPTAPAREVVEVEEVAKDVKKIDWVRVGIGSATAAAVTSLILWGLRRRRRSREEKQEIDRIFQTPGMRTQLLQIRNKYKPLLNKARHDRQVLSMLQAQLNAEIEAALGKNIKYI